jgi:hypothetical protein
MERTETGFEVTPECTNVRFTVTEPAEKGKTPKGKYYYIFRFKCVIDGVVRKHNALYMTWLAGDLLKALQCQEEKPGNNVFLWEKAEIVGRSIFADIVHVPDYKNPEKPAAEFRNMRPADPGGPANQGNEPPGELSNQPPEDEIPF